MTTKFKKITLPIATGIISAQMSIFFCFGVIAGYVIAKYSSNKVGSIQIAFGNYKIHLHHWLTATFGLAIIAITRTYDFFPYFVLGFGGGFVFQGIYCYNDWYKIIKKRE